MPSRFSLSDRLKLNKKLQEANEAAELEAREQIKNSTFTQICTKIRWIFYVQIAISISSFFFTPFKAYEVVNYYERQQIQAKGSVAGYRGLIKTFSEKHITIASIRLRSNYFIKGDTICVLRNVFYKIEGVKHKSSKWPYFLETKWVFCFIWFFFGGVAIFCENAIRSRDLILRNRLSILLLIIIVLYFAI